MKIKPNLKINGVFAVDPIQGNRFTFTIVNYFGENI